MKLTQEFKHQLTALVIGAFSLVAALAWNDAIKNLIDSLYPLSQDNLPTKFLYAGIITIVVVVVSTVLAKLNEVKK